MSIHSTTLEKLASQNAGFSLQNSSSQTWLSITVSRNLPISETSLYYKINYPRVCNMSNHNGMLTKCNSSNTLMLELIMSQYFEC